MTSAEGFLTAADGIRLFVRRWEVPQPKAVCLLVHGLAEHSGRYEGLAQALADRGFAVWALDHRGHGRSEGRRGDCRTLDEFVQDLRTLSEHARGQSPDRPFDSVRPEQGRRANVAQDRPQFVIGHSLGGLIALSYAVRFPGSARGVAVSSPALRLTHETPFLKVAFVTAVSRLVPTFRFPNGVRPSLLSHDPQVVKAYQEDPLVHRVVTARCAIALRRAMKGAMDLAPRLKIPCLLLQAGADEICDPAATARFAELSDGAATTLRRYDGLYHELFNEPDRDRVMEDLCAWLEHQL